MTVLAVQLEQVVQAAQVRAWSADHTPPPPRPPKRVPLSEPVYTCTWVDPTGAKRSARFAESKLSLTP